MGSIGRTNIGATKRLGRLHDDIAALLETEAALLGITPTELVWKLFCTRYGLEHLDRKPFDLDVPERLQPQTLAELAQVCADRGRLDLAEKVMEKIDEQADVPLIELTRISA